MKGMMFKPESIQAIIEGRKTQTRRLGGLKGINEYPDQWELMPGHDANSLIWLFRNTEISEIASTKPRYYTGETVYIKEQLLCNPIWGEASYRDGSPVFIYNEELIKSRHILKWHWKSDTLSSRCMPREAARHFITITDVRAGRVQGISEEEAKLEGVNPYLITKLEGGKHYRVIKTYHRENYPLVSHADEGEEIVFECPNMGFARCHHLTWQDGKSSVFRIDAKDAFNYIGSLHPDYINGFRIPWDSINKDYPFESNPWVFPYTFRLEVRNEQN